MQAFFDTNQYQKFLAEQASLIIFVLLRKENLVTLFALDEFLNGHN